MTTRSLCRWDVFCRVVDHYGDAGLCLRVARALASVPGREVRLWVDRPGVALALIDPRPGGDAVTGWRDRSGIHVGVWDTARRGPANREADAAGIGQILSGEIGPERAKTGSLPDVVVETFGGDLPADMLAAMRAAKAAGRPTPLWINLEYLSAEDWVEGCHGLPSPQPGGLTRWFVFPGFTAHTAGLPGPLSHLPALPPGLARLLDAARGASDPTRSAPGNTPSRTRTALMDSDTTPLFGSVFCYRESPLPALLDAMQRGRRDVSLLVPAGMPGDLGGRALGPEHGATWHGDRLTLVRIPFVDQDVYDALLAACDFNLVRGEDSFVRSQWAGRPFLWAAYRQEEHAHMAKVEAWLARSAMPSAWAGLTRWFNGGAAADGDATADPETPNLPTEKGPGGSALADVDALWRTAMAELDATRAWSAAWREQLLALPRLEDALAEFASRDASTVE